MFDIKITYCSHAITQQSSVPSDYGSTCFKNSDPKHYFQFELYCGIVATLRYFIPSRP